MATQPQVTVRQASKSDVREYIFREPICEVGYFKVPLPLYGAEEKFSELGPIGEEIAKKLMQQSQVDEIERATFRPFSITVHKSPMASWPRLESISIIPAFAAALDVDQNDLDIRPHTLTSVKDLKIRVRERERA